MLLKKLGLLSGLAIASVTLPIVAETSAQADNFATKAHHHCNNQSELEFSLNAELENDLDEELTGTVYFSVYNPSGKRTYFGRNLFSVTANNTIDISYPSTVVKGSDEEGIYTAVINFVFDANVDNTFRFEFFGSLGVTHDDETILVNFDDYPNYDLALEGNRYQLVVNFLNNKYLWSSDD